MATSLNFLNKKASDKPSALNFLNQKAVGKCSYLPFAKLTPGRYAVNEFFIKIDKKYEMGQKRLCLKIDNGRRYLMLPKRYMEQEGESPSLDSLNAEPCIFVFEGKNGDYDLKFSFEAADKAKKTPEAVDDEQSSDEDIPLSQMVSNRTHAN